MQTEQDKPTVRRARRARPLLVATAVLGITLAGSGCLVIPVPSITPDFQQGLIEEQTLESLIGLDQTEVNDQLGYPDYSGRRGAYHAMVYQGETRHSTDVYMFVSAGYEVAGGKIDEGESKSLHCYVLELDADGIVKDYQVVIRPATGITRRQDSGYVAEPASDCAKVVWGKDARVGELPGQIEPTKQMMRARESNEMRRIAALEARARKAELKHRARQGDMNAALELADMTGDSSALKALADAGDVDAMAALAMREGNTATVRKLADGGSPAAARMMFEILSAEGDTVVDAWKYLCRAANSGDAGAQAEVGYWHRRAVFPRTQLDRLTWAQERVGIRADNRIAYTWYTLAASNGDAGAIDARDAQIAADMTSEEIAAAKDMAADWKPGECPSAGNRLPAPGDS